MTNRAMWTHSMDAARTRAELQSVYATLFHTPFAYINFVARSRLRRFMEARVAHLSKGTGTGN